MGGHDHGYKLLFSHPEMVEDLLRGFVRESWVGRLDFSTLERVPGSYVGDDLAERADDVVWRVRLGGDGWLYVYLLIEFQSAVDPFMALRMLAYVALLCQDLVRRGALTATGRLPPVLPIVLYNGKPRWRAAVEVADLFAAPAAELASYRPRLRYLLLDEGRYPAAELARLRNLVAALFRLERGRRTEEVRQGLAAVNEALAERPDRPSLRRAFATWVRQVLRPAAKPAGGAAKPYDLEEFQAMLEETVREWTEQWKAEGLEAGLKQGLREGREEGLRQGLQQGEAALLIRLLERKFGPLDASVRERVEASDADRLLLWGERILTAGRLVDVFAGDEGV